MNDVLRIDDDRGRFAALAAILLGLFVAALLSRNEDWKAIVDLLFTGVAATAVLVPAVARARHAGPPPGWLSAMLVVGFALAAGALFSLADVLGANTDDLHSSTVTWISLLLAAGFGFIALRRDSAICTLLAAASLVVFVIALIDWIFSPESTSTFRYIMVVEALVLLAAGVALYRDRVGRGDHAHSAAHEHGGAAHEHGGAVRDRGAAHEGALRGARHGVVLTVLAGLVMLVLTITFAVDFITPFFGGGGGPSGVAWGWELIVLAVALALAAFAVVTREPGPGYIAAVLLLAFTTLVAAGEEGFVGWPLVLLLLFAAAVAGMLRPGGDAGPREDPGDTTREVRL